MKKIILIFLAFILFNSCENPQKEEQQKIKSAYLDKLSKIEAQRYIMKILENELKDLSLIHI